MRSVFLVTGKASYSSCGAESALAEVLRDFRTCRFSDFGPHVRLSDVEKGVDCLRRRRYDLVLAVGGGTVLDMGKLLAVSLSQKEPLAQVVSSRLALQERRTGFIAVPTTAGSGSEATHFAVVYVDGKKCSLAHASLRPDVVLIDPVLTASAPPRLTAIAGLDALCQAVESFWAVNATERSRGRAEKAIRLVLGHLAECVHDPKSDSRRAMCLAAHLAGRAIDVSKTTACHAISYPLTFQFGIPHGHAVALTLGETLLFNSGATDGDVADRAEFPMCGRRSIAWVCSWAAPRRGSRAKIDALIGQIGLETRLSDLGVAEAADRELVARNADSERLANNPRTMTRRDCASHS